MRGGKADEGGVEAEEEEAPGFEDAIPGEVGEGFGGDGEEGFELGSGFHLYKADATVLWLWRPIDRSGEGVGIVVTLGGAVEKAQVVDRAGHGSDDTEEAAGMADARKVSCGGDAARGGLESADAAGGGREANGTATVGTDAAGGQMGRDGGSFAAGGAAGSVVRMPGIVGAAVDVVKGLPVHQVLGRVGLAEDDGAVGFETVDAKGVGVGFGIAAEGCAANGGVACDVERVLDGEGDATEQTLGVGAGTSEGSLFVDLGVGVEAGVVAVDGLEVGNDEFFGTEVSSGDAVPHFADAELIQTYRLVWQVRLAGEWVL